MHEAPLQPTASAAPRSTSAVAPWWHTALIVLLIVGGSVFNSRPTHIGALSAHHVQRYLTGIGVEWLLFLLVWWGLRMKRVSLAEVFGFRRGLEAWGEDLAAAAIFWIISLAILACIGILAQLLHLTSPQKALAALAPRNAQEILLWITLSCTAGIVEELTFRGYLLRQFAAPAHSLAVGVVASSLIFGIAHGYEGAAGMLAIGVYGALFCALALLRRSLRPGMIAHAWHDIFSGLMLALVHHFHLL
ncbi:MAG TPA: CPBP family intramembrane glutamic endopeptidase [Acidobacteriaceae bacterium]|nr:CPBP family intramembrane glutamic endopeptidase [Acidobacteriaceae bacterium]